MDQQHEQGKGQQSRVHTTEISCLRGACEVSRWDSEGNENIYERCGTGVCANGVSEVRSDEWVKRNTLRWSSHIDRIKNEFVKKVI